MKKPVIRICELANKEHKRSFRQYAHVFHVPGVICVAEAFEALPLGYRLGILLHECGHLLLGPPHSEAAADQIIESVYGIRIYRRSYEGARRLEYVSLRDYSKAQRLLREVTG